MVRLIIIAPLANKFSDWGRLDVLYTHQNPSVFLYPSWEGDVIRVWIFSVRRKKVDCILMCERSNTSVAEGHRRLVWVAQDNEAIFAKLLSLHSSLSLLFPPRVALTLFWCYREQKNNTTLFPEVFFSTPLHSFCFHPLFCLTCSLPTGSHAD